MIKYFLQIHICGSTKSSRQYLLQYTITEVLENGEECAGFCVFSGVYNPLFTTYLLYEQTHLP